MSSRPLAARRVRALLAVCAATGALAVGASPPAAAGLIGPHGSVAEQALATHLRPSLLLDSHERWRPLEVEDFLAERFAGGSGHRTCWNGDASNCEAPIDPTRLRPGSGTPDYIDIHGEGDNGVDYKSPLRACRARIAVDCNSGPRTVIYYRRTSHAGHWYWDYWWFFRYNDYPGSIVGICIPLYCGDHEGDWEGVTVLTTEQPRPAILAVTYAAHQERVEVDGAAVPMAGGHPLVFVAEGTHASYPFRCDNDCKENATFLGVHFLPEGSHDGAVAWGGDNTRECATYECVRPLPEFGEAGESAPPQAGGWAGWHGKWGITCHEGCHSPLDQRSPTSPGTQPRYKLPWAPTRRVSSVAEL